MSTFKIKSGTEIPSETYVNQNKPQFEQVLKGFKGFKLNFIQKTWLVGGTSGLVAVVAVLTYFLVIKPGGPISTQSPENNNNPVDTAFFVSPLPAHDIPFETFQHNNEQSGNYSSARGSVLHIPALAFTEMNGSPVQGPVQIRFREFHNVLDLFRAGAPMNYDSAGQQRTFESAGMFEILAYQGNQPLKLAENQSIDVDLVTYNDDPRFNLYYLDTNARNWEYMDKSSFAAIEDLAPTVRAVNPAPEVRPAPSTATTLIKPVKSGKSKYIFKVNYDKARFPELQAYDNVLFEVAEDKSKFSASLYDVNWNEVALGSSRLKGYYLLHLARPDTSIRVYVTPVFASADYQKAVEKYNAALQQKTSEYQNKQVVSDSLVSERERLYSEAVMSYSAITDARAPQGFRRVSIFSLGTFNCDYPIPENNYTFTPTFLADGQQIIPRKIYMADVSVNAIFESMGGVEFKCNRKQAMILWIITKDSKMAIFSTEEFKRITKGTQNPVFPVHLLDAKTGMLVLARALRGETDLQVPEETPDASGSDFTKEAPPQFSISAYPNPAKEVINIEISGAEPTQRPVMRFYNAAGTLIKEMQAATGGDLTPINISDWNPGIYFCRIEAAGSAPQTIKFIKE